MNTVSKDLDYCWGLTSWKKTGKLKLKIAEWKHRKNSHVFLISLPCLMSCLSHYLVDTACRLRKIEGFTRRHTAGSVRQGLCVVDFLLSYTISQTVGHHAGHKTECWPPLANTSYFIPSSSFPLLPQTQMSMDLWCLEPFLSHPSWPPTRLWAWLSENSDVGTGIQGLASWQPESELKSKSQ